MLHLVACVEAFVVAGMRLLHLPEDLDPKVGQHLQIMQTDGKSIIVPVTDVSETTVTVDANHFLAGKDLTFEIKLIEIK